MRLHKVSALLTLAQKNTLRTLTPVFERTYYIWNDFESTDPNSATFLYRVKSIFLSECVNGKVEGVDVSKLENYFVDGSVMTIEIIPPEEIQGFYQKNPGVNMYSIY